MHPDKTLFLPCIDAHVLKCAALFWDSLLFSSLPTASKAIKAMSSFLKDNAHLNASHIRLFELYTLLAVSFKA